MFFQFKDLKSNFREPIETFGVQLIFETKAIKFEFEFEFGFEKI